MAHLPKKSPDAGLWKYGRQAVRRIVEAVRWSFRKVLRNRLVLMSLIKMAEAIVKLISAILELFRHQRARRTGLVHPLPGKSSQGSRLRCRDG